MQSIITWFQSGGVTPLLLGFTIASIILTGIAQVFKALGKTVPGWVGSGLSFIGNIIHFLNGNIPAATGAAPAVSAQSVSK